MIGVNQIYLNDHSMIEAVQDDQLMDGQLEELPDQDRPEITPAAGDQDPHLMYS